MICLSYTIALRLPQIDLDAPQARMRGRKAGLVEPMAAGHLSELHTLRSHE